MIILCLPGGKVTFFCANALILPRTTSIPLPAKAKDSGRRNEEPHAPFVRSVELQHALFICIPKKLVCEAVDARCFAYTGHALYSYEQKIKNAIPMAYGNDKMRTVPVLGYHFKSLDRFLVADNVIQHEGAVFFYPLKELRCNARNGKKTYHGSSYASSLLLIVAERDACCHIRAARAPCSASHLESNTTLPNQATSLHPA